MQPSLDELILGKELFIFFNYSSGADKLCFNISALYVYPPVAGEANTRINIFPLPVLSNHGYGHTSVTPLSCSNESLCLAFPECLSSCEATSSSSLQISCVT